MLFTVHHNTAEALKGGEWKKWREKTERKKKLEANLKENRRKT